jgi:hypothetical protein
MAHVWCRYPPYIHALVLKENADEVVTLSETKWPGNGRPHQGGQAIGVEQEKELHTTMAALQQQVASLQHQVERLVQLMERRS